MKNFEEWSQKKKSIDNKNHIPPFIKEGSIWWVSIGLNIGSEIYGKNIDYARPAVILKKLSSKIYLVAPITSTIKRGFYYEKIVTREQDSYVCFDQIKTCDYRRFIYEYTILTEIDYVNVKNKFDAIYTQNKPPRPKAEESEDDTAPRINVSISEANNKSSTK